MKKLIKELIIKLSNILKEKNWSITTAESCTGGGLAYYISLIPTCSALLERGYITYSDKSKQELLGVKKTTLTRYGAVSKKTAEEMVRGAIKNSHAQIAIAITGLAGPNTDETSNREIGTIYLSYLAKNKKMIVKKYKFSGNRKQICEKTIIESLRGLIKYAK